MQTVVNDTTTTKQDTTKHYRHQSIKTPTVTTVLL